MAQESGLTTKWWAKGLLFENCSCQLVCPGHIRFSQACTFERCVGYWAVRFDEGELDGVPLGGTAAVVAFDSPQYMIEGNWTQVILVEERADPVQREKVEAILSGKVGGPWRVLARFVGTRLPTRAVDIRVEDEGRRKRVSVDGILDASIEAIPGRDKSAVVTLENMFNQIHAPTQVMALGTTTYDDGTIRVKTENSHGLYSRFHWSVG